MSKRNPVQIDNPTLWELINKAASIEGKKRNAPMTAAQFVRFASEKVGKQTVKNAEKEN